MDRTHGSDSREEDRKSRLSGRTATWIAVAALLIAVGHVVYAIWRDHLNGGEGLLNVLG